MKRSHPRCENNRCALCLDEHLDLGKELDRRTGIDTVDHLGKFHKWLSDQGINPETGHGWGSAAYFDEENISNYVSTWKE